MINNFFKIIRLCFYKNKLPKIISFYNLNKKNLKKIKNIAIWLMCTNKAKLICKECKSCTSFKKNVNYDYYELIEHNNENIKDYICNLDNFFKTKPIFSNFKVIFLSLCIKNKHIIKFLEEKFENKNIYFLFYFNDIFPETNYITLNFNGNEKFLISITAIKLIYYKLLNKTTNISFSNIFYLNKILVINSIMFLIKINLYYFFKKKNKILINKKIKEKIIKKNAFFLLIFLEKYKKILFKNDNLNTYLLMNFIIEYIKN
ncbi:MAG TPA: hypothetical protein ACYCDA_00970 [Candidatus Azoamicus sp.]